MTHRKELLDGDPVSFAESLDRSDDILHEIDLPEKQEQFRNVVWDHKEQIQGIVRLHRNVREPTTAAECMDFIDHAEFEPTPRSLWRTGQRFRTWFGLPLKLPFVEGEEPNKLGMAYTVVDEVKKGRKISDVLNGVLADQTRRQNFFNDLADIMLRLRAKPMDRIGSLTVRNEEITIGSRPLTQQLAAWDSEGISTIQPEETFDTVESYIMALLECHDNAIRCQKNVIRDLIDGQSQLSNILMMRTLCNQFISKRYPSGPFILTLTNLQPHNIMVDENGHITSLINIGWVCSLPVEMLTPPYWLVDMASSDPDYGNLVSDFLDTLNVREKDFPDYRHDSIAGIMRTCLQNGASWYFRILQSPDRVCQLFREHIESRYSLDNCNILEFERLASRYWCPEGEQFIRRKIEDRNTYCERLREIYHPYILPG